MSDPRDNNLRKQKDDSLKFLRQIAEENSANISNDLFENIYDTVMKNSPDSSINLNKEIEKIISNEITQNEDQ